VDSRAVCSALCVSANSLAQLSGREWSARCAGGDDTDLAIVDTLTAEEDDTPSSLATLSCWLSVMEGAPDFVAVMSRS
jgi:hypothetical protein